MTGGKKIIEGLQDAVAHARASNSDLARLRALAEAAEPGPWRAMPLEFSVRSIGHHAAYWWIYHRYGMKEAIRQELWRACWKAHRLDFKAIGEPMGKSARWVARRLADDGPLDLNAMSDIALACNATFDFKTWAL
jgi:hypothetical protein